MCVSKFIKYVGITDHEIDLFEGQYKVPDGISYNSYLILDEKTAITDTVDSRFTGQWLKKLECELDGKSPDYLIVHHMEPDHSAGVLELAEKYPSLTIVSSQKAFSMMQGFFGTDFADRRIVVKDSDVLSLGKTTLSFITAPMVHWPEVIMSYMPEYGILFSADAFGKFGDADTEEDWCDEARRYYIGIVGKYGAQVESVIKKAATLDIKAIYPLHGPRLTRDIDKKLELYKLWASYKPETSGVVIAYSTVYGNTESAAKLLKEMLEQKGTHTEIYDLARCDIHEAVAAAFCYDKLVLASPTYNADVFPPTRSFIHALLERGYRQRTVAFIENGSWAPMAAKVMRGMLEGCKDISYAETSVKIISALNSESIEAINALSEELS